MRKKKAVIKMVLNKKNESDKVGELEIQCETNDGFDCIPLSNFYTEQEGMISLSTIIREEQWDSSKQEVKGYWDDSANTLIREGWEANSYCKAFDELITLGLEIVGDDYNLVSDVELDMESVQRDMKDRSGWTEESNRMSALRNGLSDKIGH